MKFLLLAALLLPICASAADKPNIVFVLTDDQSVIDLSSLETISGTGGRTSVGSGTVPIDPEGELGSGFGVGSAP